MSGSSYFEEYIQIAGIIDEKEAELLIGCGVKNLGFPLRLPVNKEDLTENDAGTIIKKLNPPISGVIITYSKTAAEALELCSKLGSKIIQLHGEIDIEEIRKIRTADPTIFILKSLIVKEKNEKELLSLVKETESFIDAFITDTYDPNSGASGATGLVHDWNISKRVVQMSQKPVILAGGLNPSNVYDAILNVRPAGVDAHTGVENADGRKDGLLVKKFVQEAKRAFTEIRSFK